MRQTATFEAVLSPLTFEMALPPNRDLCQSHPWLATSFEFNVLDKCGLLHPMQCLLTWFDVILVLVAGTVFQEHIETGNMCGKMH